MRPSTEPSPHDRRAPRRRVISIGGQRIDLLERTHLLKAVDDAIDRRRRPLRLASANLDHVYCFDGEADLFDSDELGQWLVLLDGTPLVRATRRRTGERWSKLAGSDLLPDLLSLCEARGTRVGFLGGGDELRSRLPAALAQRWPELTAVGHWIPSRRDLEDGHACQELADTIASCGVEFLVVGLGKPRQERWMAGYASATGARVTVAFGAATEFVAGVKQRAPRAVTLVGVEWAYRLAKEPRRLARRYLAQAPVALAKVVSTR